VATAHLRPHNVVCADDDDVDDDDDDESLTRS